MRGVGGREVATAERWKKWVKWGLIGLGGLILVLIICIWFFGDYAVRKAVEFGGTSALGVETKLDSASIGWLSSSLTLSGLKIANPPHYKTDRLFAIGRGKVSCKVMSLFSSEVVVREILIDEPELTFEMRYTPLPKSNLGDLIASLKAATPAPGEKEEAKKAPEPGKRLRIDLIRLTNIKVRFHLLGGKTVDLVIPKVELKEVRNTDGTLPRIADVFRQVMVGLAVSTFHRAKDLGEDVLGTFGDVAGLAEEVLGKGVELVVDLGGGVTKTVVGLGKGVAKGVGDAAKGVTKGVGDAAKGVTGAVKGILGGKDKKKE
jgi:hypothetical protein